MTADEFVRRTAMSRRRVLQGMLASAGLAAMGSGVSSWVTQGPARASGLLLPPGTRPDPTKPEGADTLPQIEHIIIYMQENQSYDHYFGSYGRGDGFTYGPDGMPTNFNLDSANAKVPVFHQASTCDSISGDHSWNGTHRSINKGAMDGFAKDSGHSVMGYYDQTNLPFYRGLADVFPLCDRWFSSVPGPTYPNRRFLQAATSVGIVATDINEVFKTPYAPNGTIWDRLNAHGITWKDYAIDIWDVLLFPTNNVTKYIQDNAAHLKHYPKDFLDDCRNGTLPQVSILAPGAHDQYDEGSRDVQNGEAFSSSIINSVMASPVWDKCAIFVTWDEHGGGYDHVAPPAAVAPDNIAPRISPSDEQGAFDQYGVRVPGFVVSPYSKPNYISHVAHDHTSILKFIETKFNLGAMTYRDANADDLMDCLDFTSKPAFLDPPTLPAPGLPAGGSPCQPQDRPPTNPRVPRPPDTTTTSTTTPGTPGSGSTPTVPQSASTTGGSSSSTTGSTAGSGGSSSTTSIPGTTTSGAGPSTTIGSGGNTLGTGGVLPPSPPAVPIVAPATFTG